MVQQHRHDGFDECCSISRRGMLGSLAALTLAGPLAVATAEAEAAPDTAAARRIDVHHHFFPPAWLQQAKEQKPGPSPIMRDWSAARVLEHMDKAGVATAIVSLSPWGVAFADTAQMPKLARVCNDYAAQMMQDRAGRFGLFAAMPLPNVDASLGEIAYALDTLKADGIGFMTSYGDKWPGDPLFRPVFEELDRRKAVAYFHPTTPHCCGNLIPAAPAGPATIEWPVDTARAILSLLTSGSLIRYPNIRFIFSHAGGALPALSGRISNFVERDKKAAEYAPHGALAEFKKLYYDTANATAAPSMAALMAMAPVSQIVFGSDYPYFSLEENVQGLSNIKLTTAQQRAIARANLARILPRYGT